MSFKTYSELVTLQTFEERFDYLKLNGLIGKETFGYDRIFNQMFYNSMEWRRIRDRIIVRDNGCDLGVIGYEFYNGEPIYIHHMNPILIRDIKDSTELLLNEEFLISTSLNTHNAIHYGNVETLNKNVLSERNEHDTSPWKKRK